ncbi:MAG: hypothetical protein ACE5NN_03430 [Candidatus Bathyarchaeia archaeon]
MPARKMRVEVYDELGNRYTITFEGRVTRDKALRIFDIIELLGGMPSVEPELERENELSKMKKVQHIIERYFPIIWFDAKEVQSIYEKELNEPITLSTISTYLSRLADRGILLRNRSSNRVHYRFMSENLQKAFNPSNLK